MSENGVFIYPEAARAAASSIDPNLMLAMQNNGGFGNNSNWIWILFLWMMWQNGGFNNYRNGGGSFESLAAQMNGDSSREFIIQALNGKAEALAQLAQITNSNINTVQTAINGIQNSIQNVSAQVGLTAAQTQNSILLGNADIAKQICQCCCENKLAIANQTSALQSQLAQHDSNVRLQLAQNEAADQLSVCQQTNTLSTQAERNANNIINAIAQQTTMMTKEFCDLKERELQNKINTQADIITQLRGQISNDFQTKQFTEAFNALNEKITLLSAKQPNTVPVQYPNLVAVNQTPYAGYAYGYPQNNFWN